MYKAKSAQAILVLCCSWSSLSLAADFYTIIGPDGRPMIIQQKDAIAKSRREQVKAPIPSQKLEMKSSDHKATHTSIQFKNADLAENEIRPPQKVNAPILHIQQNPKDQTRAEKALEEKQSLATSTVTQKITEKPSLIIPVKIAQQSEKTEKSKEAIQVTQSQEREVQPKYSITDTTTSNTQIKGTEQNKRTVSPSESISISKPTVVSSNQNPKKDDSKFTEMDGVQYVDNEYLEDKEFNLEGKKRFYIMSEAGVAGGRQFETVEREKGISKSVFSKFLKTNNSVHAPIVLSSTYFRLPKEQVIENLQQACFTGKKIGKAKFLSVEKDEIGFWPAAPIKENFAYEVVKLDKQVENIQLSSYASSQKSPSYYWPLVVFLDQQGCVIEGVSGFKSEDVNANHRQFSSLVGVLKKPTNAHFLFMTPLAESVDIDNLKLSNTGQIKLSILR